MNTVDILIYGLCLWLTDRAEITAIIPDFHRAMPAHNAVLEVPKEDIVGGKCPESFGLDGNTCTFRLNGAGAVGGVRIDIDGEMAEYPDRRGLDNIPKIQHDGTELRMRPEYVPEHGWKLAAQMVINRGTLSSEEATPCPLPQKPCARHARWTLRAEQGNHLTLVLSNLVGGLPERVPLTGQAEVTIRNRDVQKELGSVAHWCLYFSMFEEAGCPGPPDAPAAPPRTATRAVPPHAHGNSPAIETIACSNSQYP